LTRDIHGYVQDERRKEILNWLFDGKDGDVPERIQDEKRSPCSWFLESSAFENWIIESSSRPLICHGMRTISIIGLN